MPGAGGVRWHASRIKQCERVDCSVEHCCERVGNARKHREHQRIECIEHGVNERLDSGVKR